MARAAAALFTATVFAIPATFIGAVASGDWRWLLVTALCWTAIRVSRR